MNDDPPRLILGFRPIDLARVLLVALPAAPGLLFLLAGVMLDLRAHARGAALQAPATTTRAAQQARGLYLAGAVTLLGGTLGMAAVVWKIARTRPEEAETPAASTDGRA